MKKFLAIIVLTLASFCLSEAYASATKLKAYSFAFKSADENGKWTDWTDWEECNILVVFNADKERITIYSKETQEYDMVSADDWESDGDGGKVSEIACVDGDGERCTVRWRIDKDGGQQVYVDYPTFCFVYNVRLKD